MVVVGIDVGDTFTDLTEIDEATGAVRITKVPSTPNDEARAVMSGLERIADPRQVRRVVHGTTVATNAIIQRRGSRVAYVTTEGFKDLIEIGRTKRRSCTRWESRAPPRSASTSSTPRARSTR